jgi:hypothetical protein
LVERYLEEIAKIYDIKWRSDLIDHYEEEADMDNTLDDDNSDHGDGGGGQGEVKKYKADLDNYQLYKVTCTFTGRSIGHSNRLTRDTH